MGPEYSFIIERSELLAGIALESVQTAETPKDIKVLKKAFLTDNDGEFFYTCLDGFSKLFLVPWLISERKHESAIDNCLVLVDKKNFAHVYINCPIVLKVVGKRDIAKGEGVSKRDLADIQSVEFPGIDIKNDCDIFFVFSVGWRRGYYFDIASKQTPQVIERGDFGTIAASLYRYMMFPEVFRMDEATRKKLFDRGWFPFVQLLGGPFEEIYKRVINDFTLDDLENNIMDSYDEAAIKKMFSIWTKKPLFQEQAQIPEAGLNHYLKGEYIAAICILYPQIEGLMRRLCCMEVKDPRSPDLIKKLKEVGTEKSGVDGLFLPLGFGDYLKAFYFKNFDLDTGKLDLSRNTISHGVAKAVDFDRLKAFQAIMILDQILWYV